ncbi:hypothetical protein MP228_011976 [Amoeboaphelidium protococcarum]|nr:hypothetical protein MP228_011976 [Amoeboaphelidium protococcarum]
MESDSSKIEAQIAELEKKIAVEKKVKSGAESMKAMLKDKNAKQEIEISINESQKRLDFLEREMQKLKLKKGGIDPTSPSTAGSQSLAATESETVSPLPAKQQNQDGKPSLGKANSGIWSRLGFSSKSVGGGSSLSGSQSSLAGTVNTNNASAASTKGTNTDGLTRKQSMLSNKNILTPERIAAKIKDLQEKLDVEQKVKVGAEKLVQTYAGKKNLSQADVKAKADLDKKIKDTTSRTQVLKTALNRYQAMHVEGLATDEDSDNNQIKKKDVKKPMTGRIKVTVMSAKNIVGKKSSKTDAYVAIRVDNVVSARTKVKPKLIWNEVLDVSINKAQEIEFSVYDADGNLMSIVFFQLNDLELEVEQLEKIQNSTGDAGIEAFYDMEPSGQLQLKIAFSTHAKKNKNSEGLQRATNVKKKKQHIVNGHKFESTQFYGFMKCALCSEYLLAGVGYQCESCKYVAHKKCFDKVVTRCITKPDEADDVNQEMSKQLRHDVPHRWEIASSLTPQWCIHCGYMLPVGTKKAFERCHDCNLCAHSECKLYIPNLCGMTMETANKMLSQMMEIEKIRTQKAKAEKLKENQRVMDLAAQQQQQMAVAGSSLLKKPTLDDFNFIAVLGKGNFGKVMLAEEKVSKKLYAIKVLKKEFILQNDEIESTRSEKRVFQTINRGRMPFLVELHSCFQTETRIYFVMEYVSGGDLMLHIQRQQFNEKRAKFYACEVLLALEYFHKNDVVYRDLKLDNILLTLEGHVKVADYGLCKEGMSYTGRTNTFCGTPEFMAPEILQDQEYGRAVDWWAFGVLIFEMLLGQSPFKGQDEEEIFAAILQEEVQFPPNLNKDAVSILTQLLVKDPTKRLGASQADAADIKAHPYFAGVNWEDMLAKKIPPPFIPQIKHDRDVSNFDEEFTREMPVLTPIQNELHEADQEEFKGFTYVAEWLTNYESNKQQQQQQQQGPPAIPPSSNKPTLPSSPSFVAPMPPSSQPPVAAGAQSNDGKQQQLTQIAASMSFPPPPSSAPVKKQSTDAINVASKSTSHLSDTAGNGNNQLSGTVGSLKPAESTDSDIARQMAEAQAAALAEALGSQGNLLGGGSKANLSVLPEPRSSSLQNVQQVGLSGNRIDSSNSGNYNAVSTSDIRVTDANGNQKKLSIESKPKSGFLSLGGSQSNLPVVEDESKDVNPHIVVQTEGDAITTNPLQAITKSRSKMTLNAGLSNSDLSGQPQSHQQLNGGNGVASVGASQLLSAANIAVPSQKSSDVESSVKGQYQSA